MRTCALLLYSPYLQLSKFVSDNRKEIQQPMHPGTFVDRGPSFAIGQNLFWHRAAGDGLAEGTTSPENSPTPSACELRANSRGPICRSVECYGVPTWSADHAAWGSPFISHLTSCCRVSILIRDCTCPIVTCTTVATRTRTEHLTVCQGQDPSFASHSIVVCG